MNFQQFGAPIGQAPGAFRGDVDIVLQPDASPAFKIDTRLYGDYGTGRKGLFSRDRKPGGLMNL